MVTNTIETGKMSWNGDDRISKNLGQDLQYVNGTLDEVEKIAVQEIRELLDTNDP